MEGEREVTIVKLGPEAYQAAWSAIPPTRRYRVPMGDRTVNCWDAGTWTLYVLVVPDTREEGR